MLVYSKEKMEHALSLMAPPHCLTVAEVARRIGVKEKTLYDWRKKARLAGSSMPGAGSNPGVLDDAVYAP